VRLASPTEQAQTEPLREAEVKDSTEAEDGRYDA